MNLHARDFGNWMILCFFTIIILGLIYTEIIFRKKKRGLAGKAPLNKVVYRTGKLCIWGTWVALIIQSLHINLRVLPIPDAVEFIALTLVGIGFLLFLVTYLNLGDALRVGLPEEETTLKTKGLYRFSRNPMYISFYLLAIASVLYTLNPLVLALAVIGIFVHHKVVLAEENFLQKRFGKVYTDYCKRTRRYL